MDTKRKLVELLINTIGLTPTDAEIYANDFIAHGVTVQEWVSVKEHLPQENEPENTLCDIVKVLLKNGKVSIGWCDRSAKLWWHMNYDKGYFISNDYDNTPVIAWQPLVQPEDGE